MAKSSWMKPMMRRLFKLLFVLVLLAAIGLVGFAYLGDLSPTQNDVAQEVTIELD